MVHTFVKAIRIFLVLTILTGIIYPLAVTAVGKIFFPSQANGSLIMRGNNIIGSELVAQKFISPRYFQSRPSATDFQTIPSGASNLSPTATGFRDAVVQRQSELGKKAPVDLLTASGSGLDPHITPEAAHYQIPKIAKARGLDGENIAKITRLVDEQTKEPQYGFLGHPRVNVLLLNLALDRQLHESR